MTRPVRLALTSVLLWIVLLPVTAQAGQAASYEGREVAAKQILVRFRTSDVSRAVSLALQDPDVVAAEAVGRAGAVLLRSRDRSVGQLLEAYGSRSDVVYAQPDYLLSPAADGSARLTSDALRQTRGFQAESGAGAENRALRDEETFGQAAASSPVILASVTVNADPPPTLTAISPTSGVRGTTVSVTLTGTNFLAGLTIDAGPGITVSNVVFVNSTSATADFAIGAGAGLGLRNIIVTTSAGADGESIFTVNPPAPTLTAISPASGPQGGRPTVTLTGTNFVVGLTIGAGADITVRNVDVVNSTTAMATFDISAAAALGERDVTVTTSGGTTEVVKFTVVVPEPPTLTGISPASGVRDTTINLSLTGTNFVSGLAIDAIPGITVNNVIVTSSTTASAAVVVAADAELGDRGVTVTTSGGTSAPATFTVADLPPVLTSISPASGVLGGAVSVALNGDRFTETMTIEAISGITVSNINVTNTTAATATFSIAAGGDVGPRDVAVTTSGGTSAPVTFTVNPQGPALSSIDPATGSLGADVNVMLTGLNFVAPVTIDAGASIVVGNINVISPTTVAATFSIGLDAEPGARSVRVTTPGGTTFPAAFTVIPGAPTLTGIEPSAVARGSVSKSVTVTLTGTSFYSPKVNVSGTGVTAGILNVASPTSATATFTIAADAELGPRDVTVTNAGGTSSAVTFTVLPPAPAISAIAPAIGVRGRSIGVTLTGSNFVSGGTTLSAIAGVTTGNVAVTSPTTLTATFTIAPDAVLGDRSVTVTTAFGASDPVNFAIADPFPDLSISSSHIGNFGVGFNENYTVTVTNSGTLASSGETTVTDTLPAGLTFVSGTGPGWSCSAAGQTVTCLNSVALAVNASSSYTLTVAVGAAAAGTVNHTVTVAAPGDLNAANDSATDPTVVAPTPSPSVLFSGLPLLPGEQESVAVALSSPFPHDITGVFTLGFIPNAVVPVDDPAIQFESGGRTVTFTIPANERQARFGSASSVGPIGFQTGTVAGRLTFSGTLTAGTAQGTFTPEAPPGDLTIRLQPPTIRNIQTGTQGGFSVSILVMSPSREVTELSLSFDTNPRVQLSCGNLSGCSVSGQTLTLDATSLFASWYSSDTVFGGLSMLRLPFNVQGGQVKGTTRVILRNNQGFSNVASFDWP